MVEDVIKQVNTFVVHPIQIVRSIESLLERGYLTRDFNDNLKYFYTL